MRQVQKERLVRIRLDEFQSAFRVTLREEIAVDRGLDDGFVLHQRQGRPPVAIEYSAPPPTVLRHVVAVGDSEKRVEPVPCRQELRLVAQMPLADDCRCVPVPAEQFRDCGFVRMNAEGRDRAQDLAVSRIRVQANALRVAACQEARSRRSADAGTCIEVP